jgi:hypothetical protein
MTARKRTKSPPQLDAAFAPKSYWSPRTRPRNIEAEIARITLSASTADIVSLRARPTSAGRIQYRMIHADASDRARRRIGVSPVSSARPLTLGELIGLLERACYRGPCPDEGDDERYGGVIWGTLRLHLEHGVAHADDYFFALRVASEHYPQLERYYADRLSEWCLENCAEDEDCGKLVRLRTGRFARKLNPPGYSRP